MRYALHRYGVPTSPGGGSTGGTAVAVPFPTLSLTGGVSGASGSTGTIAASPPGYVMEGP